MTLGGLLAGGWALQIGAEWQSVMTGDAINRGQYFSGMHSCQYCTIQYTVLSLTAVYCMHCRRLPSAPGNAVRVGFGDGWRQLQ